MLTPRALATLNGFNSRQLHRITGRSYQEEAITPSYDLLTAVRTRRHHWLGHILRMPADRLVCRAVLALGQRERWTAISTWQYPEGHAPPTNGNTSASRRPPRMGTRWPIPLFSTGKPLRGATPTHHHHYRLRRQRAQREVVSSNNDFQLICRSSPRKPMLENLAVNQWSVTNIAILHKLVQNSTLALSQVFDYMNAYDLVSVYMFDREYLRLQHAHKFQNDTSIPDRRVLIGTFTAPRTDALGGISGEVSDAPRPTFDSKAVSPSQDCQSPQRSPTPISLAAESPRPIRNGRWRPVHCQRHELPKSDIAEGCWLCKMSYSLFCHLRLFYIVPPTNKDHEMCLCCLHDNGRMIVDRITKADILPAGILCQQNWDA